MENITTTSGLYSASDNDWYIYNITINNETSSGDITSLFFTYLALWVEDLSTGEAFLFGLYIALGLLPVLLLQVILIVFPVLYICNVCVECTDD